MRTWASNAYKLGINLRAYILEVSCYVMDGAKEARADSIDVGTQNILTYCMYPKWCLTPQSNL